jgi:hypothetical protein
MNQLIIKVEVESAFVDSRGGISQRTNKPYEIHEQKAWAYLGSKFPKEITLSLDKPGDALGVGHYEVDLMPALDVGDFGRLTIEARKLRFIPARPAAVKASA